MFLTQGLWTWQQKKQLWKLLRKMPMLRCCSISSVMSSSATPEMAAHQAPCPWDSPGKSTGGGCHFLLQCMKVYSAMKRMPWCHLQQTWINPEIITLSEVRQRRANTIWYHLHVKSKIWYKWTYLQNRNWLSDIENKLVVTRGERERTYKLGVCD